eukprot:evm.model.scf_4442.2 EVM.evm.TU.scf_4442.2   scf_4442:3416-5458(+)
MYCSVCCCQPPPHSSFAEESAVLQKHFGCLGDGGSAYVLGDYCRGMQWHVFAAEDPASRLKGGAAIGTTIELCLTGLNRRAAAKFFRDDAFVSPSWTTKSTGIADLLNGSEIDDYVFEPCGYSMNGLKGSGFITVHVTPEEACSYASVEFSGLTGKDVKLERIVTKVLEVFGPQDVYLAVTSGHRPLRDLDAALQHCPLLKDYAWHGVSTQSVRCGGWVGFCWLTCLENGLSGRSSPAYCSSITDSEASECEIEPRAKKLRPESDRMMSVLKDRYGVEQIEDSASGTVDDFILQKINLHNLENTLYVFDLGMVYKLYGAWTVAFPDIAPFYAVKCNPDVAMISLLGAAGAGFDCASDEEVELVVGLGIPASRIIFANACKRPRDIRCARKYGVELATFDNRSELVKIARIYPGLKLILRIRADDPDARCQLGNKYGAEGDEVLGLLQCARDLGLEVVGISFHVGSGASNPASFTEGIKLAKGAFEAGKALGFHMHIVDIGGGFSGGRFGSDGEIDLGGVPAAVNGALMQYFADEGGLRVIAEPGRYFAEAAATLATYVYGQRERVDGAGDRVRDYYVTDGLYGSFNCVLYDHAMVTARTLRVSREGRKAQEAEEGMVKSTVFGPTCDGLDTVLRAYPLPKLVNGDWILFPNMGAYTLAGASNFNGFNATDVDVYYVWSRS